MLNTTEKVLISETYVDYFPKRPCSDIPELLAHAEALIEEITPDNVKFLVWNYVATKNIAAM
jgi:hypothetical protein